MWGLFSLLALGCVLAACHKLWRIVIEHVFREYQSWRISHIPQGMLVVSSIHLDQKGEFTVRLQFSHGWCAIYWKIGDSVQKLIEQVTAQTVDIQKIWRQKGLEFGTIDVGGVIFTFPLPAEKP